LFSFDATNQVSGLFSFDATRACPFFAQKDRIAIKPLHLGEIRD
jgi:hypothetical protein